MFMRDATFELSDAVADRLIEVVGADAALRTAEERRDYRDPYWAADDDTYDSSLVLFPSTVDQVQEIVRIAAEHAVPLWPSSQGRNNGYGGPSGRVRGSVLVSLRRMNRVLEINRELAYAVVEPGVSWFELRQALDASGNEDLWFSIPDLGWGSVIGNSLDNGMTYGPNGSDFQKICGMEVVLGTGELLRTGLGAQPGNDSWHLYTRGFGPALDPLFMQSNFGIVVRAGIWLMRRPEAFAPLFLTIPRHEQLAQAIDIFRELRLDGVVRGVPSIQNFVTMSAQFDHTRDLYLRADKAATEETLDRLGDESGLGRWGARTALWGDRVVVEHHRRRIVEAWSAIEGGTVMGERIYARDEWDQISSFVDKVQAGIPSMDIVQSTPTHIAHAFFAPVLPLDGALVSRTIDRMRDTIVEEVGNNHVCALYFPNDRTCIVVNPLTFDVTDHDVTDRAYGALKRLVREGAEHGYTEYRAHIDLMDLVADQLSFNDHAYRRFAEAIKDAVDPAGVIAPGRNGIWPRGYRTEDAAR